MPYGNATKVSDSDGVTPIAVASNGTVYTKAFSLRQGLYFGVKAILSSTGSPSVQVQFQQSDVLPATEGAADADWVIPDGMPDVWANLNDKVNHIKALSPVPMTYGRFKLTGLGANPADTTIDIRVFQQDILL